MGNIPNFDALLSYRIIFDIRDQERQDLKPGGAKGVVSDFVVCLDDNEPFETVG